MTDRQGDRWLDEAALAAVPWRKLRHARGKADGLPTILRNLGSPAERARKVARLELDDALWEGPRTFTAGVAAVPFLVDSALHTPYPDRAPPRWSAGSPTLSPPAGGASINPWGR